MKAGRVIILIRAGPQETTCTNRIAASGMVPGGLSRTQPTIASHATTWPPMTSLRGNITRKSRAHLRSSTFLPFSL